MRIFFLLFLALFYFHSEAQNTFQKTFGDIHYDQIRVVKQTTDGGYIIMGQISFYDSSQAKAFIVLVKTNELGDTSWVKTYTDINETNNTGLDIEQTFDNGYIISGALYNNPCLLKVDSVGNPIWFKSYSNSYFHFFLKIETSSDSGYVVLAKQVLNSFDSAFFLVKFNMQGNVVWAKSYSGNSGFNYDWHRGYCLAKTYDDGFIIGGYTTAFSPEINQSHSEHAYLVRVDSNGDTLWTKIYGDTNSTDHQWVTAIIQTADSGFMIAGEAFFLKTNGNGNFIFAKSYNTSISDFVQVSDGGYISTGSSYNGFFYASLLRVDNLGNVIFLKDKGAGGEEGRSIQQTSDGGYVLGAKTYNSFSVDSGNFYLIKTDSAGNSGCNEINRIGTDSVYFLLEQQGPSTVTDMVLNEFSLVPKTGTKGVFSTLCSNTLIYDLMSTDEFTIYPNPANSNFTIRFNSQFQNGQVEIFNLIGKKMFLAAFGGQLTVGCGQFPDGLYFVKLQTEKGSAVEKLIIQ